MKHFEFLSQFVSYKPQCPFCTKDLGVDVALSLQDFGLEVKNSQYHEHYIQFIFTAPIEQSSVDFRVRIGLNNRITYKILNPQYWDKQIEKASFIEVFNRAHFQVFQNCINPECKLNFFRQSLPLSIRNSKLEQVKLYNESLNYDKFLVQNDFIENKLKIYVAGSSAPPIDIKFFDLNKDTAQHLLTRIRVASVFS